jgi:CheY-like chemotaxis protein
MKRLQLCRRRDNEGASVGMQKTRLLLVEDDLAMVELLRWTFEREDYDVASTASGEEALLLAHERSPDIVLLDWMIEELAGIEVWRRLPQIRSSAITIGADVALKHYFGPRISL